MKIECPECGAAIRLKEPRPGSYRPTCRNCDGRFQLVVASDGEALVSKIGAIVENMTRLATEVQEPSDGINVAGNTADLAGTMPLDSQDPTRADLSDKSNYATAHPTAGEFRGAATRPDATNATPDATMAHDGSFDAGRRAEGVPERLGGYRVMRELGRGAMGAVYVARQISLARDVALKTIQSRWAESPKMLARFMREAFAAAQLSHHNMVQIYDLGAEQDIKFFSMELVSGCNLAELVEQRGRLPVSEATGLIIQAARGLQAAHNQGMVHRDVKPANLMLSDAGVVKVADLGLVKMANRLEIEDSSPEDDGGLPHQARGDLTLAHNAMGTAAFMAPEQGDDASTADHRADIYSLGCTLYVLLTGQPPFDGQTAMELITKHKNASVVRPDMIVEDVPKELADIVIRMVEKDPSKRQSNMGAVISDLQRFAGAHRADHEASEIDVSEIAALSEKYASLPSTKRQQGVALATAGGGALVAGLVALLNPTLGIGFAIALLAGGVTRAVVKNRGLGDGVLSKFREWLAAARASDYLTWVVGALLLLAGLWALNLLLATIIAVAIGVAAGIGFATVIDRPAEAQQQPVLQEARSALQRLRLQGADEISIRNSVAQGANRAFVERLFGYAATRETMPRRLSVRDAAYDVLHAKIERTRQERQQRQLQKVEQQRLLSEGIGADEARDKAEQIVAGLAAEVRQLRSEANHRSTLEDPSTAAREKRERTKRLLAEGKDLNASAIRMRKLGRLVLNPILGPRTRFLVGAAIFVACLLWIQQNQIVDSLRTVDGLKSVLLTPGESTEPWRFPVLGAWVNTVHVGLAGLMLVFSAQYGGWRNGIASFPAAFLVGAAAHFGLPAFGLPGGPWTVGAIAGMALFVVGIFLFGSDD